MGERYRKALAFKDCRVLRAQTIPYQSYRIICDNRGIHGSLWDRGDILSS